MSTINFNAPEFWNYLSDAWSTFEDKDKVEAIWETIASGIEYAMNRTLDVQRSRTLEHMPVLLDDGPVTYSILHSGLESDQLNTYPSEYGGAKFKYYIDDYVVSLPTLTQEYNFLNSGVSHTYTYGVDYTLSGYNTIHWLSNPYWDERYSNLQVMTVTAPIVKRINPVLVNLWMRLIELDLSKFSSYNTFKSNTLENTYRHLKYLIWALITKKLALPTVKNIQNGLAIARGFPFAYASGIISYTFNGLTYTVTVGNETYVIPSGWAVLPSGTAVSQFDVLASGLYVWDYQNNLSTVMQHSNILTRYNTIVVEAVSGLYSTYSLDFYEQYRDSLLPIQLHRIYI